MSGCFCHVNCAARQEIKKQQPARKGIIDQAAFFFLVSRASREGRKHFMLSITLMSDISELATREQGGGLQYGNGSLQVLRDPTETLHVWDALIFYVVGAY